MVGTTLGHYRIVGKLGEGGMGEVFRAEDTTLKRQVALKVLPAELAEEGDRLNRFQREAEALAALNHPNIVMIHSIESDQGVRFLTMELVDGKALSEMIPPGGMDLKEALGIAVPLADALAAAHARGVVHRDIKPANVMVSSEGRVKFLDFGLAKLHPLQAADEASQLETEPLTQEGLLIGTMPYMAPEQLEGGSADARADIFSLGVVLYEMITGSRPFGGENPVALISAILKSAPPPVSDLREDLPGHLARLVDRCLAKAPGERFQMAGEVRDELTALQRDLESGITRTEVLQAPQPDSGSRSGWRRMAAAVLAVAALAGWLVLRPDEASGPKGVPIATTTEPPKLLVLPFENLGPADQAWFTDGMTEEITSRLASVSGLRVISRTTALQYKENRPSLPELAASLGVDYVVDGTVRWASDEAGNRIRVTPQLIRVSDDSQLWSTTYDRVIADTFTVQSEVARGVINELGIALRGQEETSIATPPTESPEAYEAYLRGKSFGENWGDKESLLAAVRMLDRAIELDPDFPLALLELGLAHEGLADVFENPGSREASEAAFARAEEVAPEEPAVRRVRLWRGGDIQVAVEGFRDLVDEDPNDAESWQGLGWALFNSGSLEEGLQAMERAAELDPDNDMGLLGRATSYSRARRYPEALHYWSRRIDLGPHIATSYWLKAMTHMQAGDLVSARATLEEMPGSKDAWWDYYWWELLRLERKFEEGLELMAQATLPRSGVLILEAELLRALGNTEAEKQRLSEALPLFLERVEQRPDDLESQSLLGLTYAGLGKHEEAIGQAQLVSELLTVGVADGSSQTNNGERVALIYARAGKPELAIEQLDQLLSVPSFMSVEYLGLDHRFDDLRDHPEFQAMLERHGGGAG